MSCKLKDLSSFFSLVPQKGAETADSSERNRGLRISVLTKPRRDQPGVGSAPGSPNDSHRDPTASHGCRCELPGAAWHTAVPHRPGRWNAAVHVGGARGRGEHRAPSPPWAGPGRPCSSPPRPLKGAGRWRAACGYAVSQSQSPDDVLFPSPSDHQAAPHFVTGGQRRWPGSGDPAGAVGIRAPTCSLTAVCFSTRPAAAPPGLARLSRARAGWSGHARTT